MAEPGGVAQRGGLVGTTQAGVFHGSASYGRAINPAMNSKDDKNTARIRRQYSAEEKVRLLRFHLVEGQHTGKPTQVWCKFSSV